MIPEAQPQAENPALANLFGAHRLQQLHSAGLYGGPIATHGAGALWRKVSAALMPHIIIEAQAHGMKPMQYVLWLASHGGVHAAAAGPLAQAATPGQGQQSLQPGGPMYGTPTPPPAAPVYSVQPAIGIP